MFSLFYLSTAPVKKNCKKYHLHFNKLYFFTMEKRGEMKNITEEQKDIMVGLIEQNKK